MTSGPAGANPDPLLALAGLLDVLTVLPGPA